MSCVKLPRLLKRQQAETSVGVPTMVLSETLARSQAYSYLGLSEEA
jgi:hypothetical protein